MTGSDGERLFEKPLAEQLFGGLQKLPAPPLPLFVLRPVFAGLLSSLLERHPDLFDRLGDYQSSRFLLRPSDLPFALLLIPQNAAPELSPHNLDDLPPFDAMITGPIGKFIALVNGTEDGDALFFSRDLVIEGDTEAVLALRNAVDDMEIDLVAEIDALLDQHLGPLAAPAKIVRERAGETGELLTGLKIVLTESLWRRTIDRARGPANRSAGSSGDQL